MGQDKICDLIIFKLFKINGTRVKSQQQEQVEAEDKNQCNS